MYVHMYVCIYIYIYAYPWSSGTHGLAAAFMGDNFSLSPAGANSSRWFVMLPGMCSMLLSVRG